MTRLAPLALTLLIACGSKPAEPDAAPPTTAAPPPTSIDPKDPRAAILKEIPGTLQANPAEVTEAVRALAASLPAEPSALTRAIATAPELAARPFPADAPDAPRSADALAQALAAKRRTLVAPFERALLASAVLDSRGVQAEWGYVGGARHAATEILARRFVLRAPNGGWLTVDGAPLEAAEAERVRPLDLIDLHAHDLALRALGAVAAQDADLASRAAGLARRLRPEDPAILFVAARAELMNGLVEVAAATMDKAAAIEADAMTWYALGRQARLEERPFKADERFKKAIELDPRLAEPHIGLAELAIDRLDLTPADQHPGLIAQAKKAIADARAADANARGLRLTEAHLAALDDDYETAERLLREETELHPDGEEGWMTLAQVLNVKERSEEALAVLERARERGVASSEILHGLGALYVQAGRLDDARKALEAALTKDPNDPEVRAQIAQLMLQQGDLDGAQKLLEAQVVKFPDEIEGYLLLAQVELEGGKVDQALGHVDKALERDPKHKDARILAWVARVATGRQADAQREGAIAAAGSRKALAQMCLQNGLVDAAEGLLVDALESEKDDVVVPVLLAAVYASKGRMEEAGALRDKILAPLAPDDRKELERLFDQAMTQAAPAPPTPPAPGP